MGNQQENAKNQAISDLMDDLASSQSIDDILADDSNNKTWHRYQTISAVLKNQHSAYSDFSLTQSISAQIAKEPVYSQQNDQTVSNNVIEFSAWQSWRKLSGGLAVAASVAFAMVFSVQFIDSPVEPQTIDSPSFTVQDVETNTFPQTFELTPADKAEQQKLEEIQRYLDNARQKSFGVNEQYVTGRRYQSFIVPSELALNPLFEKQQDKEKKPENKDQ